MHTCRNCGMVVGLEVNGMNETRRLTMVGMEEMPLLWDERISASKEKDVQKRSFGCQSTREAITAVARRWKKRNVV